MESIEIPYQFCNGLQNIYDPSGSGVEAVNNLICLNSNTYHGFTLDEAIDGASRAGFRYIELAAVEGYTEHVRRDMSDAELSQVKTKLRERNVECLALGAHTNLVKADGVRKFRESIRLAHRLGSRFIVTATGDTHDDHDVIEDTSEILRVLATLVEDCDKFGLKLVIETHGNNFATGQAVKSLVANLRSETIGINYDTGNVIFYGNTLPYEDLQECADSVYFMHLKDKAGRNSEWNFPAIGRGGLDFARILRILETTGCNAPMSVEVEFTSEGPADIEEVHDAVEHSYRAVQTLMRKEPIGSE